jgi:hypothetical protein
VSKITKGYHQAISLLHIIILVIHHLFGEKWFALSVLLLKSCSLPLGPWINFSHLSNNFTRVHLHYISPMLLNTRIPQSFHLSLVHDKRDPSSGTLFTLAHLCVLHLTAIAHLTCVFASLTNDHHKHLGAK